MKEHTFRAIAGLYGQAISRFLHKVLWYAILAIGVMTIPLATAYEVVSEFDFKDYMYRQGRATKALLSNAFVEASYRCTYRKFPWLAMLPAFSASFLTKVVKSPWPTKLFVVMVITGFPIGVGSWLFYGWTTVWAVQHATELYAIGKQFGHEQAQSFLNAWDAYSSLFDA